MEITVGTVLAIALALHYAVSLCWVRVFFVKTKILMDIPWMPARVVVTAMAYLLAPVCMYVITVAGVVGFILQVVEDCLVAVLSSLVTVLLNIGGQDDAQKEACK